MANTFTKTTINDSNQLATIHVFYEHSDSASESDLVVFDASALIGANNAANIMHIKGCMVGINTVLRFEGDTDFTALVLPDGRPFEFDFSDGYISNQATTPTGDITMDTTNVATGDNGWFIIKVKKAT